ncbi:MAG: hypothetical protein NVSMB12_04140 [Acidimicrobiales bacterium]
MADVIFVGILVVFFVVAGLLVRLCEQIVGSATVPPEASHEPRPA